jgi:hypothetical protein
VFIHFHGIWNHPNVLQYERHPERQHRNHECDSYDIDSYLSDIFKSNHKHATICVDVHILQDIRDKHGDISFVDICYELQNVVSTNNTSNIYKAFFNANIFHGKHEVIHKHIDADNNIDKTTFNIYSSVDADIICILLKLPSRNWGNIDAYLDDDNAGP